MYKNDLIKLKRGSSSEWNSVNPILKLGEPGYEKDTNKLKIGDGTTRWNSLPYINDDLLSANDALLFKGTLGTGGTITSLPSIYEAGWTYKIITAGTYAGKVCEINDLIISIADRLSGNGVNNDWVVVQANVDGVVSSLGGTINKLSKFSSSLVIEDSIISESGNIVNVSGILNVNNISVSVSGHSHTALNITDFHSSVSGLLPSVSGSGYAVTSFNNNVYSVSVTGVQPSGDYSVVGHVHSSSNITDFNTSVSGLLPVSNIIGSGNINVSSFNKIFTVSSSGLVQSTTTNIPGASGIVNIVQISQANYDALSTIDPNTIYFIT